MRTVRRLRLGYGSKADSYPHEKPHSAGIDFLGPNGEVGSFEFNGTDWDVVVNGSPIGTIPGSGGGGGGGGLTIQQGSSDGQGPILATNSPAEIILPRGLALATGWQMLCKPPGSITVDLRYDAFPTTPDAADSITGTSTPAISASTSGSGALTGWTTTLAAGGILQAVVTANTGVRWWCLEIR